VIKRKIKLKFDIAIPVFNEEATIELQILALDEYLSNLESDAKQFSILIADNGSTDSTNEIAMTLASSIDRVTLISVGKKGVGLALRKAWEKSDADVVGYMDLDLATSIIHLNEVVEYFMETDGDVINASRLLPQSVVQNRKIIRTITSRVFNSILRSTYKTSITDGMRRQTLPTVIRNGASADGWFFATQLLLVSEMLGLKVQEIPVHWIDDGNSKVKIPNLTRQYISEISRLRRSLKNSSYKKFVRL
jgi:glycosyltransferase involved in cell wall biosynthesis